MSISAVLRRRRDTAANWTAANPTPLAGQLCFETDTGRFKLGDGSTAWNALAYVVPYLTATDRVLGRSTAGAGSAEEITCTSSGRAMIAAASAAAQTALLSNMVGDSGAGGTKGLVPAPAAGDAAANKFLKADGTWAVGGGGASALDDLTDVTITAPATGATLVYNGSAWVDGQLDLADSDAVTGALPIANGGTGQTGATAAFNALSPTTTRGDLITRDATNNVRLNIGASGRYLRSNGTDPAWAGLSVSDIFNQGTTTTLLHGNAAGAASFGPVDTADISDDAVTYAKMQNVSATDKVLGRSTAGAGNVEEIECTSAGRALLDDATASDQRTTLGFATDLLRLDQSWLASPGAGVTLSAVAAADAFLAKSNRNIQQADLTPFTQVRMTVRVTTAATAGTKLVATYHTAFSTTLTDYVAIGTSAVECAIDATGITTSSWIDLAAGAKADVFTTIKQTGGDGATNPVIAFLTLQFRRR